MCLNILEMNTQRNNCNRLFLTWVSYVIASVSSLPFVSGIVYLNVLEKSVEHLSPLQLRTSTSTFPRSLPSLSDIKQSSPPCWEGGESHLRSRNCSPPPQVKLHSVKLLQSPQFPWTKVKDIRKFFFSTLIQYRATMKRE